ncbi:ATP-binding protein [Haliea sp. E17]|uniref:ATP-binding protein n=1 Tax=Haliea sp. E17 TaxID=3401576 RepID=UPI003AAC3C28
MSGLQLHVLGDLEVIRGGRAQALPPSRKTRGLLAFLALQGRPFRREHLCELLWEIPDDPRGSLRWSLSKIRKLVDEDDCPRIIADRATVAFDASGVAIDVLDLHRAAAAVEQASLDTLRELARHGQGAFLEGLDLPDFHDFHAWCVGERERTIRSRARVLEELCARLGDQPEVALEYAQARVALQPFEEAPRADLVRLLMQLDRRQEAEEQHRIGLQKLAELGAQGTGILGRALRQAAPRAAAASTPVRRPTPDYSLVGRDAELAQLQAHIGGTDGARVLLLRGEPGLGKSRLLQAAAAIAREAGTGILKASAFESESMRPFGVWNDALRRALPDNATSRLLASGDQVSREQVFDSLVADLMSATARHPVVALCDDIHWADDSSLNALHYVLRNKRNEPLRVIIASREAELREHPTLQQVVRALRADGLLQEIMLQPLSAAEITQLVQQQFPGADAAALSGESGGNPLFALELARAGIEGGSSLSELVAERMAGLDDNARNLMAWCSVLAPRINVRSLEQASGLAPPVIDAALERAEQQGLLLPGERGLRFAHELIRRAIYESLSPSRRHAMHRRVAELLEVEAALDLDLAADLAHHARRSGDPWLAGKAMVSAGRLCLRFYANDTAMDLYRQGLEFAAQLGDAQRVCLSLELGEIRLNAHHEEDWSALVEEFVGLAEQAMDHGSRSHARIGYQMAAHLRWMHGENRAARRFSQQAERVSRGASEEAQVLGQAEAAKCLALLERDLSEADALVMEARALARQSGRDCVAIPITLGILRYYEDKLDEAVDYLEEARTQAKAEGDRISEYMVNEYLAMVEIERSDCHAAQRHARAMVEIGERLREGSERPFAGAVQALCHYGISGEVEPLESALQSLRVADAKQRLAFVLNRAARCSVDGGHFARAAAFAREALELARLMERPSEVVLALLSLERVHRAQPELQAESLGREIREIMAGSIASWARERGEQLLAEEVKSNA